jgi:3-oxoacyl-[acyl-carrier protein] reductase
VFYWRPQVTAITDLRTLTTEDTMANPLDLYRLDGRVAVITGAASGIGAATSDVLAAAGAKIVAGDLDEAGARKTADRVIGEGGEAIAVAANVTVRADVDQLVQAALDTYGRVDIVANIAGTMFPGLIEDLTDEQLDKGINLNLKGVIYGTQAAIKAMRPRTENGGGTGSIVNVSSGAIDLAYPGIGLYAFTKAAVAMLSMTTAKEVGQYGIRVNAIAPGTTITPFTTWRMTNADGSLNTEVYDAFLEQMKGMSPLGLAGEAIDQAMMIHYLVCDASKYATGNIFRVNGGQTMMW